METFTDVILEALNELDEDCLGCKFPAILDYLRSRPAFRFVTPSILLTALRVGYEMAVIDGNPISGVFWIPCNVREEDLEVVRLADAFSPSMLTLDFEREP